MIVFRFFSMLFVLIGLAAGCHRTANVEYVSSDEFKQLAPAVQSEANSFLSEACGTPSDPKMMTGIYGDQKRLQLGFNVYRKRCAQCHGDSGDGAGPQANHLYPRPRDYRKGVFKFTSTPYGMKPVRLDLAETIRRGVSGTSMPSFHLLSEAEVQGVVEYVLALTHRGELEGQLSAELAGEEKFDADIAKEAAELIAMRWKEAAAAVYLPSMPQPVFSEEHVTRGRAAFLSKGCAKCHGDDGRGQAPENLSGQRKDIWGYSTRAADLTSGMLRGGPNLLSIYRRIHGGINGTPMPSFQQAFSTEPETTWDLVAYVMHVSGRRRQGEIPPAGSVAPYLVSASESSPSVSQDQ